MMPIPSEQTLRNAKIQAVISSRSSRRVEIEHDRALYKQRNSIEPMFGRVEINRAITTQYDRLADIP